MGLFLCGIIRLVMKKNIISYCRGLINEPIFRWVVISLPFLLLFAAITVHGVDVPAKDTLFFVPLINDLVNGQSGAWKGLLSVQLNEHRPMLPVLIIWMVTVSVGWHAKYLLIINVIIVFILFLFIQKLAEAVFKKSLKKSEFFVWSIFSAVFLSSLSQWEIWMDATTLNLTLGLTASVGAILFAYRSRSTVVGFWGAATLCFLASFSASYGLFSWPVVALLIIGRLFRNSADNAVIDKKMAVFILSVWLILMAGTVSLYFGFYEAPKWPLPCHMVF